MKILCSACEGKGYVDPPYGNADTSSAITCPCCGGSGVQVVVVAEE
jgi:DnaJ-class molecular chaperone